MSLDGVSQNNTHLSASAPQLAKIDAFVRRSAANDTPSRAARYRVVQLPETLGACHRLQKLALAGNRLAALPASIARCERLELLLVKGWANRDVAAFLKITEQQVANYRFAAVKKLTESIRDTGLPPDVFPELQD